MKKYRIKPKLESFNIYWFLQVRIMGIWVSKAYYCKKEDAIKVMNTLIEGSTYHDR